MTFPFAVPQRARLIRAALPTSWKLTFRNNSPKPGSTLSKRGSMAYLCLSYDHRLIDGAYAGAFLNRVQADLEGFNFSAVL